MNCLMYHILYQIFKIILNISSKKHAVTDNPPIRIYVNKIDNTITFTILCPAFTPETIKLLGRSKRKIVKQKTKMVKTCLI